MDDRQTIGTAVRNWLGQRKPAGITPDALFAEHGDVVYRFCLRLCGGNPTEAEDLAQDVLLLAWKSRADFEGRSSARTYLYRIAVNRYQRIRVQAATTGRCEESGLQPRVPDPAHQIVLRLELDEALQTLSNDLRTAFLVVKSEGLTYREAALVLEIPQGTVQYRVHEATMRLRAHLNDDSVAASSAHTPQVASDIRKENCHAV